MAPALIFAPAALSVLAFGGRIFPAGERTWSNLTALLGLAAIVPLPFLEDGWRTVTLSRPGSVSLVVGIAGAWGCVLLAASSPAWRTTALTGVAASASIMAALSDWSVPALMFLGCAVLAGTAELFRCEARAATLAFVGGGVALGIGLGSQTGDGWRFPEGSDGPHVWAIAAGALLIVGAVHLLASIRSPGVAVILPAAVLSIEILYRVVPGPRVWAAAVVLAAASVVMVLWGRGERPPLELWAGSMSVGAVLVVPEIRAAAAAAFVLAVLAGTLRASEPGYGSLLKAAVAAFMPLTVGFAVVAAAAGTAFDGAAAAADGAGAVPGTAAAVLTVVVMGLGLWFATRAAWGAVALPATGRVAAPAAIAGLAFAGASFPTVLFGFEGPPLGAEGGVLVLHAIALGAGGAAAWFSYSREDATIGLVERSHEEPVHEDPVIPADPKILGRLAAVVLGLGVAAVTWLVLEGLRVGFL